MPPLKLFDSTSTLLTKSLDLRASNQGVIASNIANSETPGYAPARFNFETELKNAIEGTGSTLATTHNKHISLGASSVESVTGVVLREPDNTGIGDENGVSVDDEMIALSENQLLYETDAKLLKKKFTLLKYVVQGGQ